MFLNKSLTILACLFLVNISLAQDKAFQISPFNMTFTEGHQAMCEEMEKAKMFKHSDTEYSIDRFYFDIEVGAKFKLSSKNIKDVEVYERAMFRYAIKGTETEGDIYYEEISIDSDANFFSEWTKIEIEKNTYTVTENYPLYPSTEILMKLPVQAIISPEMVVERILAGIIKRGGDVSNYSGEWSLDNRLWIAKRARQIKIKYTQNNTIRTRLITFFSKRGEC